MPTTTSRRAILAGAAAMPIAAVPAAAAIPDPALVAAERLRSAQEAWDAIGEEEPKHLPLLHPEYEEWQARFDDFGSVPRRAIEEMAATRPTSRAGAQAMIEAFLDWRVDYLDEEDYAFLQTLAEAMPNLV